ncbi:MAG TPA: non-ribosomal peptide synthetase [Bryobacteraceae bacterium]
MDKQTDDERRRVAFTDYPRSVTVARLFEEQTLRTPSRVAVVCGAVSRTYSELDRDANRLARHLLARGANAGDFVGICLDRSVEMLIAMLAVMKMGGAYVPLDPAFPRDRLEYMADDASLGAVIVHDATGDVVDITGTRIHLDDERDQLAATSSDPLTIVPDSASAVYLLYTSGSTGKPKGVQISHRSLVNLLCSIRSEPGIHEDDILLAVTTLSFDIAEAELLLPLIAGARVHIATSEESADPRKLLRVVESSGATILQATPGRWRMLLDAGWEGNPLIKLFCTGEPLRHSLAADLVTKGELWNLYGPTETTIWSSICRIASANDPITIGWPVANTWFYILDEEQREVPAGQKGELYIGGDGVAIGYLNRPDLTAQRFLPDPFPPDPDARMYRTGDIAALRDDGSTEVFGRLDGQVKIRGFRVELGEIESVLGQCPLIRESAVVVRTDPTGESTLVAYFVTKAPNAPIGDVRQFLQSKLPAWMIPGRWIALNWMPVLPNGKIDRNALPEAPTEICGSDNGVDDLESQLLEIWRSVLEQPGMGRNTDFFDAGATSILTARAFAQIEKQLGKDLPLATILQAPTVATLAAAIRNTGWAPPWETLVPISTTGSKPPLFLVHAIGGNVVNFRSLSSCFDGDQPIYGIQARGLNGEEEVATSIESMAADYIRAVRSVQSSGSYRLGGFSAGGVVAFEMARQLQKAGDDVSLLILLDTQIGSPDDMGAAAPDFGPAQRWRRKLLLNLRAVGQTNWRVFAGYKIRNWRMALHLWQHRRGSRRLNPWEAFMLALRRYQPKPYEGDAVLFRAANQLVEYPDPTFGWGPLILGDLRMVDIAGDHDDLLRDAALRNVGAELCKLLQQSHREQQDTLEQTAEMIQK